MSSDKFLADLISREVVGVQLYDDAYLRDSCNAIAALQEKRVWGDLLYNIFIPFIQSYQITGALLSIITSNQNFNISFIGNYNDNGIFKPTYIKYKAQSNVITDFVFIDAITGQEINSNVEICGFLTLSYSYIEE